MFSELEIETKLLDGRLIKDTEDLTKEFDTSTKLIAKAYDR